MTELVAISQSLPSQSLELLLELGEGETGFSGTSFGAGTTSVEEYIAYSIDEHKGKNLPEGWVPQTTFWIVDRQQAVGMLRMRHRLTDVTRISGGHIGYYVRPEERGKGYARVALSLGLTEMAKIGVLEVMVTTTPENIGSNRVIKYNGGILRHQVKHPENDTIVNQYWIKLEG